MFCVLTILYYSVTYNQVWDSSNLAFSNMMQVAETINSLMSEPLFVGFCSVLIFVVLMKFMHAFIYLTFVSKLNSPEARVILFQNTLIFLSGLFLLFRFTPFFVNLGGSWIWTILIIVFLFMFIGMMNKIFIPVCRIFGWFEKYVVDTFLNFVELVIRFLSFMCCRFQKAGVQAYIIYSFAGILFILIFILLFYIAVSNIGV